MLVSANQLKWLLRFYPPLLFQRIWITKINKDYTKLELRISKSIFNLNYNRSIFGGTIYAAADVCYPVLLHQLFSNKGYKVAVWSRSAEIHFLKKCADKINFGINLSNDDIDKVESHLIHQGKFTGSYPIIIFNKNGDIAVSINCEVYIRNLNFKKLKVKKVYMNDEAFLDKGYLISTDKKLLNINVIYTYLDQESYWSKGIPYDKVAQAVENSLCFGVYHNKAQIGFARVITDKATFAYLADVFILTHYRKQGLSKWLLQTIMDHPDLQGLRRWSLATADAQGLYAQFGFTEINNPERWMQIFTPYKAVED